MFTFKHLPVKNNKVCVHCVCALILLNLSKGTLKGTNLKGYNMGKCVIFETFRK